MKNTIELAAEFIRRAAFVDANALLKGQRVDINKRRYNSHNSSWGLVLEGEKL